MKNLTDIICLKCKRISSGISPENYKRQFGEFNPNNKNLYQCNCGHDKFRKATDQESANLPDGVTVSIIIYHDL